MSEMRLRGIRTRAAANVFIPEFLADFNRRFARAPAEPQAVWRRPPRDLARVLSCRYTRVVARDNTVRLGPRWVQIPRGPHGRAYAGRRVEVRELLDGRLVVLADGQCLAQQAAPTGDFSLVPRSRPSAQRRARPAVAPRLDRALAQLAAARPSRPSRRHPWRRAYDRRLALQAGYTEHRG